MSGKRVSHKMQRTMRNSCCDVLNIACSITGFIVSCSASVVDQAGNRAWD